MHEQSGGGRRLVAFFALTYAFSWAFWIPQALAARGVALSEGLVAFLFSPFNPAAFGPLVGALVLALLEGGWRGVADLLKRGVDLRFRKIWLLPILLLPCALFAGGILLSIVTGGDAAGPLGALESGRGALRAGDDPPDRRPAARGVRMARVRPAPLAAPLRRAGGQRHPGGAVVAVARPADPHPGPVHDRRSAALHRAERRDRAGLDPLHLDLQPHRGQRALRPPLSHRDELVDLGDVADDEGQPLHHRLHGVAPRPRRGPDPAALAGGSAAG